MGISSEIVAEEQSFKWSHFKISFSKLKEKPAKHSEDRIIKCSKIDIVTGWHCSVVHLNAHTLGFHPHTQKLQPPRSTAL